MKRLKIPDYRHILGKRNLQKIYFHPSIYKNNVFCWKYNNKKIDDRSL